MFDSLHTGYHSLHILYLLLRPHFPSGWTAMPMSRNIGNQESHVGDTLPTPITAINPAGVQYISRPNPGPVRGPDRPALPAITE
jgi:hypothetical protein